MDPMDETRVEEIRQALAKPDLKPETLRRWLLEALDCCDEQRRRIGRLYADLAELTSRASPAGAIGFDKPLPSRG